MAEKYLDIKHTLAMMNFTYLYAPYLHLSYEPVREKTNNLSSDKV